MGVELSEPVEENLETYDPALAASTPSATTKPLKSRINTMQSSALIAVQSLWRTREATAASHRWCRTNSAACKR